MPKFNRYERFAMHVAANPGLTRDDHRNGFLFRYSPVSQNELIQATISSGMVKSVPVRGQRAHKLMPSKSLIEGISRLGVDVHAFPNSV